MKHVLLFTLLGSMLMLSCNDDNNIENQEELITTVRYDLIPRGGGINVILIFRDLDGDGGNAPTTMISDNLKAGKVYDGILSILNEAEDPAEDITIEIRDEAEEHQFFFQTGNQIQVAYNDTDNNGKPIGLKTILTAGNAAASQTIKITLRHEPDKNASGVSGGNIQNAGGETDIEVLFTLDVEQ